MWKGRMIGLVKARPILAVVGDWKKFLGGEATSGETKQLRQHERTGRPLGNVQFIRRLEQLTGRMLEKLKPGPKGAGKVENK